MRNLFFVILAIATFSAASVEARDTIRIVGSSTVFPFSSTVAETFGKTTNYKTPIVESTGSGGGFKLFCSGVGEQHPDITNASRAIKASEIKRCNENGVNKIFEVKIGYDGIVLANNKDGIRLTLSLKDIYMALAKTVPDANGNLIPNPNTTWSDVRADLPNIKIEVLGPPPTSGTRDAFVELAMEVGAKSIDLLNKLSKTDEELFKKVAFTVREDGAFIEAGENDNLIVQKLHANKDAYGIFGFSFLDQNTDVLQGSLIEDTEPTFENIANGSYKLSRPLFFYVKGEQFGIVPGIEEYINEFTSDRATGQDGYLSDKGLIPLSGEKRALKLIENN